jgi:hypothetical protein
VKLVLGPFGQPIRGERGVDAVGEREPRVDENAVEVEEHGIVVERAHSLLSKTSL